MSINLTLLFEVIAFLAFIYSFKRLLWKPILNALDARDKKIADGLAAAEQGK
ncbi:MAG: F0F1 ATP synthase subunit B, partial [Candidatus Angelobacter sp.]